ncbi:MULTISPECIES: FMN-binding protein [unclassified Fusibacter]|uniref:FMN-binding protein n=1 Tax=unclassified Fusibacter TaxID=2624464 RepID=UPI0013E908A9|nr:MULTISPECIES: FMN-binding protein [unclassified Fusibacter]MCK8059812.1 FMN-binding protein [Fusibacter sp. A2]NPE21613.1 FMN-binding protein [Fusibacter sp. A1]
MAKKKKQILYPVFFMILITVIFVSALAVINEATKEIIAKQEALKVKENILYVFGLTHDPTPEATEAAYDLYIEEKSVVDQQVFYASKDGTQLGYAFVISGPGLWGSMTGYAAVSNDLDAILGISFVSHSETPGLGGRVDEDWFKDQFRGIAISKDSDSAVFRPAPEGNVDAITGATLTSESVRVIINTDIIDFITNYGGDL